MDSPWTLLPPPALQMGIDPATGEMMIIEMNPRVSRSSALASKATGFPIAKIAAKLAVGLTLDQIPNDITLKTPASFEPSIDYIVTKVSRQRVLGVELKRGAGRLACCPAVKSTAPVGSRRVAAEQHPAVCVSAPVPDLASSCQIVILEGHLSGTPNVPGCLLIACPVSDMAPILHGCLPACRFPVLLLRSSQVPRRS